MLGKFSFLKFQLLDVKKTEEMNFGIKLDVKKLEITLSVTLCRHTVYTT